MKQTTAGSRDLTFQQPCRGSKYGKALRSARIPHIFKAWKSSFSNAWFLSHWCKTLEMLSKTRTCQNSSWLMYWCQLNLDQCKSSAVLDSSNLNRWIEILAGVIAPLHVAPLATSLGWIHPVPLDFTYIYHLTEMLKFSRNMTIKEHSHFNRGALGKLWKSMNALFLTNVFGVLNFFDPVPYWSFKTFVTTKFSRPHGRFIYALLEEQIETSIQYKLMVLTQ